MGVDLMALGGVPSNSGMYGALAALALTRRKVFVSYHHSPVDQVYRDAFEKFFATEQKVFIAKSVQIGEISPLLPTDTIRQKIRDDYLSDSTVTVVLIGAETWQRKHVDWEISSSIRETKNSSRSGLLGIILPSHPDFGKPNYTAGIIPPRLVDNQKCGYANIYHWSSDHVALASRIETAFQARSTKTPDNSYPHFIYNKSGASWY